MASTAQDALAEAARQHIQPALRAAGYRGSYPTWMRRSERGDWAIVNVQRSTSSTAGELLCIFNYGIVSEPALAFTQESWGKPTLKPSLGHADWNWRLSATVSARSRGGELWWLVKDEASAQESAADMARQLAEVALPKLLHLLDRPNLVELARRAEGGSQTQNKFRLAVLLADNGPGEELDRLLASFESEGNTGVVDWARARAARVRR